MSRTHYYEVTVGDDDALPAYFNAMVNGETRSFYRWSQRPDDDDYAERIVEIVLRRIGERITRWVTRDI